MPKTDVLIRLQRWSCLVLLLTACVGPQPTLLPTATATSSPPETPVLVPTSAATPLPSLTPTLAFTPTPPSTARRLTTGGCCVQPFWSPDGAHVWFIDRPSETQPSGVWGIDAAGGGEPQFITDKLGLYSLDRTLVAYPESRQTIIERVSTGERWVVPSEGRAISFSPDGTKIAWQVAPGTGNFDQRLTEVWMANLDGTQAQRVAQLVGGGFSGWFPDGARLLVSGRAEDNEAFLAALTLTNGSLTTIARGPRLRGGALSPEGAWVAFQIQFSGDATRDGIWVARTDGSETRRLDLFGGYRWRSRDRLLMIPLELGAGGQRFVEVDVTTGEARMLTDPALTSIHIEGGDWALSPDGERVVFVSAEDHNLWMMDLP